MLNQAAAGTRFTAAQDSDAVRQPEVYRATTALNHRVNMLHERVEALTSRLSAVLSSPTDSGAQCAKAIPPTTPLALCIHTEADRIEAANDMLSDLLSRLEI